jgi:hypothetical protein
MIFEHRPRFPEYVRPRSPLFISIRWRTESEGDINRDLIERVDLQHPGDRPSRRVSKKNWRPHEMQTRAVKKKTLRDAIEELRKQLPPFLTIKQARQTKGVCQATIYNDIKRRPDLAIKFGRSTRIVRDVLLDDIVERNSMPPSEAQRAEIQPAHP